MRNKLIALAVCMLFFMLVIPTVSSSSKSDIEIEIYAGGTMLRNIGTGVGFTIHNNGDEPATVTFTCNMIFSQYCEQITLDVIIDPDESKNGNFGLSGGIKRISVSAQVDDYIIEREGFSIGQLVIFMR